MENLDEKVAQQFNSIKQKIWDLSKKFELKENWKLKLYRSAYLFHHLTAFSVHDKDKKLVPFAYDNQMNLTEDGYITRYLGRKFPHAIEKVEKYQQHPKSLHLPLPVSAKQIANFAKRLYVIKDVKHFEINLKTTNRDFYQLSLDIIMFSTLINKVLTKAEV